MVIVLGLFHTCHCVRRPMFLGDCDYISDETDSKFRQTQRKAMFKR